MQLKYTLYMQIIDEIYEELHPDNIIKEMCPIDRVLFFDIETTGLSKETTNIYLIGCGYYINDSLHVKLIFGDNTLEEYSVIKEFFQFASSFSYLIHFNGSKFDLPYLAYKSTKLSLNNPLSNMTSIDIYNMCKPLRYLLFPDSMRQKKIEEFMHICRKDMYDGGQLIEVYKKYESNHSSVLLEMLLMHNREDVIGMHKIIPILHYSSLLTDKLHYIDMQDNKYKDYFGRECHEVLIRFHTEASFPYSFTSKTNTMYMKADASTGELTFRLPIYEGTFKHYFTNYRDYWYLPEEEICIHKDMADSVDKHSRIKATKETASVTVSGTFLNQPSNLFEPCCKTSYKDKKLYFPFPDGFDESKADEFGSMLLSVLASRR